MSSNLSHSLPSKPSTTTSANLSFMAAPQPQQPQQPSTNDALLQSHHHHHHTQPLRLSNHALLPPLDIHSTRFSSSKLAHNGTIGIGMGTTAALNSPSAAAFGGLGFGNGIMDGGLGISATNDLDHGATGLSEMFENQLSLTGVDGIRGADDVLQQEINLKNVSGSGWICSSVRCLAHNLPNNSHCYICRSPRPHELVLSTSNPSTPPRSASSSSSTFSFPPSPSSTTSAGSGTAAFMFAKQQQQQLQLQNGTAMTHPPRLQSGNGALSGGTSLGLITGAKTLYSTPPPPSLHLPPMQNGNANGIVSQASHLAGGLAPQVLLLPALPAHLLPARQAHNPFLLPTTTPTGTGNTNASANANPLLTTLTNILAPSGLRLSQGGRVRNVCPDALNPILMFWPDNEPLPTLGQCRPALPPDYAHSGKRDNSDAAAAKSNGLPPILNTGNVGPMEKQPLDWTCGVCKYINWRRRKVCQCCFPYAPGNEPPANHEDKLKVISALLTSTSASGPAASLPLGPTAAAFSSTTPAFNPAAAPSFAPAAPTPLAAAQHQLVQQIQRDQHQLLQMQLQLQIQKAQAQLNLFTQQQQQQRQQQVAAVQSSMGLGLGGAMISSPSGSASPSEMGNSRTGSPFVLGANVASTITTPGAIAKPTSTSSTPSPLSIFPGNSTTAKKSIWAMDGEAGTPTSSTSASGSPSSTARSSPTSFTAVDPEATVKLGNSNWFGSVAQTSNGFGNKFGEIGSGKVSPLRLGEGVTRKASLPISQIAWPSPPPSASSRTGSPALFGNGALVPSSSSSSSLPSLAGLRAPGAGMGLGNGSFGMGNAGSNGGSMLF